MVGSRIAVRAIGLLSTVILARLLRPEDFGLVALSMALVTATEVFGDFSFDVALIRDGRAGREHYDTVWTLTILRAILVASILVALAWPAAAFFGDARVSAIVFCLAAATFVEGWQNVGIVDFRKELDFHRVFIFGIACKLAAFVSTLSCAILWRNYWALIVGIVASKACGVILSYMMHPYRPRLKLTEWRALIGFSKWMLANNISNFLSSRLDTFAIGRIVGASAVGLYEIATEIASLPTYELIWPIQRALFPGYAKLGADRDRLISAYLGGLAVIMLIALPAAAGIACTAPLIIEVFLGSRWLDALPLLQILTIGGILRVGFATSDIVLLALGRAKLLSHLALVNLGVFAILIVTGTILWGPIGAATGAAITAGTMLTIYLTITLRVLSIPFFMVIVGVWRSIAAVMLMVLTVRFVMSAWPVSDFPWATMVELLAIVGIGVLTYTVTHVALWRLSGSPDGAERDILAALVILLRRGRPVQGLGSRGAPNPGE
jgi:lipopolysaccharide exporter